MTAVEQLGRVHLGKVTFVFGSGLLGNLIAAGRLQIDHTLC